MPVFRRAFFYKKKMKRTLILLLLIIPLNCIFSQSVITGKVVDGEFNDFLPFANIVLQSNEGEFIDGTTSDFLSLININEPTSPRMNSYSVY